MSNKNYIKTNKEELVKILNLKSVYFSLGKPIESQEPQVLTESFVSADKHNLFFNNKKEKQSLNLSGAGFDFNIHNQWTEKDYEKNDFKLFKDQEDVIKQCNKKEENSELNTSTKNMLKDLFSFFKNKKIEVYSKLNAQKVKVIPESIYINSELINSIDDLKEILSIKTIYILDNLMEAKFTEVDLHKESLSFSYHIEYFKNEVILNVNIRVKVFNTIYELKSAKRSKDGFIFDGDKKIYTSNKDLHSDVKNILMSASEQWDLKLNKSGGVYF